MTELITLLSLPFVQRALLGGVLVAGVISWLGILVVLRKSSFFGDAIAHSALTGVAIGLLLGWQPILAAAVYAVVIAWLLPVLRKNSLLPIDTLLGFLLPFSMGIGVLLLSRMPGYQPELMSFLFGSILSISWTDIWVMTGLVAVVVIGMVLLWRRLLFAAFDPEYAQIMGVKVQRLDMFYHGLLALMIVAGTQVVGIVLVNALLVIPASIARLWVRSLNQMVIVTPIVAMVVTLLGITVSFVSDLPTGPTIAVVAGMGLLLSVGLKAVRT